MRTLLKSLAVCVALLSGGLGANAFSLIGPFTSWQIPSLNYNSGLTAIAQSGDLGGPMNLGEEYRWGAPVMVYGFDSTFVEYFGPEGVAAVEAAIRILNQLPSIDKMSPGLEEFPLTTSRYNSIAQQLKIRDLKSMALSVMLQNLGLACPERFTWTIHNQLPIPNTTPQLYEYLNVQRNFDPVTWLPSAYVNNSLYTFRTIQVSVAPPLDVWDSQELLVDVSNPNVSVIASAGLQAGISDPRVRSQVYGVRGSVIGAGNGLFYTGLTRDDVGAYRYMYRRNNVNWQAAPAGATGSSGGVIGPGGGSPWEVYSFQIINPIPGSPWTVVGGPFVDGTNVLGGVVVPGNFEANAGRGGPGQVSFVRIDVDPLLGQYTVPVTINYPENVISSTGQIVSQSVQRTITAPDILFTAADLGIYTDLAQPYVYAVTGFTQTQVPLPTPGPTQAGPGIIEPGIQVIFNKVGTWVWNTTGNNTQIDGASGFVWGSYDGSTNAPIVYPRGSRLQELESQLFRP